MKSQMWVVRVVPVASALVMAAAPVAFAQFGQNGNGRAGSELFEWSGRVDREVQVVMRAGRVWTNDIGRTEPGRERSRVMDNLPRRDGQVSVQVENGRGTVDVIQQPSAQNNYTTIVRIQDPRSGSDNYRLTAYWQAYSNGDVYGRNRGRDRDMNDCAVNVTRNCPKQQRTNPNGVLGSGTAGIEAGAMQIDRGHVTGEHLD